MAKKTILVLQGGSSLGAFQGGVWEALGPWLTREGHELVAVAGASIGALNASIIARHAGAADAGVGQLLELWRRDLATVPVPFIPLPGQYWRAWNGLLTGLLLGNRSIQSPLYMNWTPFGEMTRSASPLYGNGNAERTVERRVGTYAGQAPRLLVGASDVKSGALHLFDSARQGVTPRHIAASMAIPNLLAPIEVDGRQYWDGDLRNNSLVDDVLPRLREDGPHDEGDEWLVVAVDMFSAASSELPVSAMQSAYRWHNMLLGERVERDARHVELANQYRDALRRIREHGGAADSTLAHIIDEECDKAWRRCGPRVELLHVGRENFPFEHVSREFDFSPDYIEQLIEQGRRSAMEAIDQYERRPAQLAAYRSVHHHQQASQPEGVLR